MEHKPIAIGGLREQRAREGSPGRRHEGHHKPRRPTVAPFKEAENTRSAAKIPRILNQTRI